jgi:hypothetical protein
MRKALVMLMLCVAWSFSVDAQLKKKIPSMKSMIPKNDIVCYGKPEDQNTVVPPPHAYEQWTKKIHSRTQTLATFEVTYIGFPPDNVAKNAFQKAIDIWSSLLESTVPIRITAVWQVITDDNGSTNTILGGANPGTYFTDFNGAQKILTWYPVALAEKMAGEELNEVTKADIFAQFNSAITNWYFGTDGIPQAGKTDFVTVVLHEIGHGLGITKSYTVVDDKGDIGEFFSPYHIIYDHFVENNTNENFVRNFVPPSAELKTELTSGAVYFRSPQLEKPAAGPDNRARLYAPGTFDNGSSIAHLDETTYNISLNALMTPQIGTAEVHHDPGPIVLKMLADMGWVNTLIQHTPLPDTENVSTPYEVKVTLVADQLNGYNYNPNEVKLHYTTDDVNFTTVPMTPTGTPNEFAFSLPSTGSAITYGYYISVKDNLNRTLVNPGVYTEDGEAPVNFYYLFEAGPDTRSPIITHSPIPFLLASDTELTIDAVVTDNIGVASASLDYQINGVNQSSVPLTLKPGTDSAYTVTVPLPVLQNGDNIKYRIMAKDNSVAQNEAARPGVSQFYTINVVTLAATQDSYSNDFNSASDDFIGDNIYTITTPSGFSNGAIHTSHPYPDGTGTGFISNYVYQLRIPIRLKSVDATIKFDEIVLVEPGEDGSEFGDDNFFDYVVIEGSKDGGLNWKPLANGYDSRDDAAWLAKFNSGFDNEEFPNSTGQGTPALYKQRTIDMTNNGFFAANDVIVIRFRLLTDQLVHGWGWAIDNIKIQIDDVPPTLLHNHVDYILPSSPTLAITTKVTDNAGVSNLFIDYKINSDPLTTEELTVSNNIDQYTLNLTINGLAVGDKIEYRIRSEDINGNASVVPVSGFFQVPAIEFGDPVSQYISDFNSTNTDFVGNFFSIRKPSGFNDSGIHSSNPYPDGFGLTESKSNFSYMLKKPITINANNPYMAFDEIGLVEYTGNSNKDMIVVEGSKNNGATWETFLNPYSAFIYSSWRTAFNIGGDATPSLYRSRLINLTSSGKFVAGDKVLIRFKLTADVSGNGWGWSIDNLSIQGPITGIESKSVELLNLYPNPVTNGLLVVELARNESGTAAIKILNAQGQTMINDQVALVQELNKKEYSVTNWSEGIYFLCVDTGDEIITRKFIKADR